MNSKIIALGVAFALVCTTQSLASWRDVVDMAFETVWMIGQEAQYTCGGSGARMNVWMAEEMMEADGLTAIDTTSPAWQKEDETWIARMHKEINVRGADAWCKDVFLEYGPRGIIIPNAVLFDVEPR